MTKFYKTLIDGKSFHGGSFSYSLPTFTRKGKWHKIEGEIVMCETGFHLTNEPKNWWHRDAKCYEAEYSGEVLSDDKDKICVRRVRLVRELTLDDLAQLQIFYEGNHVVREGWALAHGSSTALAYGSSTVEAYDSSTVKAYGSSTVKAYDSSTVKAYGSSTVEAYSSSTVEAYGSSTVEAYDSSTVNRMSYSMGATTLSDNAIEIDRRTNPPTVRGNFQTEEK